MHRHREPPAMSPPRESRPSSARPRGPRRWVIGLSVVALVLAGYAVVLHELSRQVGAGVESSLRVAPAVEDHHHRAD